MIRRSRRPGRQLSLGLVSQPLFRVGDRVRVTAPEDGIAPGASGVVMDVLPWELGGANPIRVRIAGEEWFLGKENLERDHAASTLAATERRTEC